jgi:hypothetical protein
MPFMDPRLSAICRRSSELLTAPPAQPILQFPSHDMTSPTMPSTIVRWPAHH